MRYPILPVTLVLLAAGACGQHPTAPDVAAGAAEGAGPGSALETFDPLEARSVTGRATNVVTGAGAAGVAVRIGEVASVVSDANGDFTLTSEAIDGSYRVVASGPGVVERQASIVFPGQAVALSLIPSAFNLRAFDQFARSYSQPDVLERWADAPALVIETSLLDRAASLDASGLPLETLVASADQQSEAAIAELVAQLTRALPIMTGGRFTAFSAVSAQTTPAGSPVESLNLGAITVVRYSRAAGPCRGFGQIAANAEFVAVAGRVGLDVCTDALAAPVAAHELGHALGYGHVSTTPSVMTAVVTGDVTEFDRQAGAIAYQRAPGNRAPDVDPEAFTVNLPLRLPMSHAGSFAPALP